MNTRTARLFAGLVSLVAVGSSAVRAAPPELFPPSHLFVSSFNTNEVFQFAPDGTLVQTLNGSGLLSGPEGVTFGPDGLLYVAASNDDEVQVIDAANSNQGVFDAGGVLDRPTGVAFGPLGDLYVANRVSDRVNVLTNADVVIATLGAGTTIDGPRGLTFSPDGQLYVVSRDSDEVLRFAADGSPLPAYPIAGLSAPYGITFSPTGFLIISSSANDNLVYGGMDATVSFNAGDALLDSPYGIVVGPDGLAWAASENNSRVVAFDGPSVTREFGVGDGMSGLGGVTFSPFIFSAKIKGVIEDSDGEREKVSDKGQLLWSPGSCRAILTFPSDSDIAGSFGAAHIVVHGQEGGAGNKRVLNMTEIPGLQKYFRVTQTTLRANGKITAAGLFVPKQISGTLSRTGLTDGSRVFKGTVKTLKRLN